MSSMISRLEQLADRAAQKKTRLMIDAEQTYFQPAIDHLVLHLQRKYNRKIPLIYGLWLILTLLVVMRARESIQVSVLFCVRLHRADMFVCDPFFVVDVCSDVRMQELINS